VLSWILTGKLEQIPYAEMVSKNFEPKFSFSTQTGKTINYSVLEFVGVVCRLNSHTNCLQDPINSLFLTKRCVSLVVLCLTKVDIEPVHRWLSFITTSNPDARVIIVGTSQEDKGDSATRMNVIRSIFQHYRNIKGLFCFLCTNTDVRFYGGSTLCCQRYFGINWKTSRA
jgi:hypothetical protein